MKLVINLCKVPLQEKKNHKRTSQGLNETQATGKEQSVKHCRARPCRVVTGFLDGSGNTANRETAFSVSFLSHPPFSMGEQVEPMNKSTLATRWPSS